MGAVETTERPFQYTLTQEELDAKNGHCPELKVSIVYLMPYKTMWIALDYNRLKIRPASVKLQFQYKTQKARQQYAIITTTACQNIMKTLLQCTTCVCDFISLQLVTGSSMWSPEMGIEKFFFSQCREWKVSDQTELVVPQWYVRVSHLWSSLSYYWFAYICSLSYLWEFYGAWWC